MSEHVSRVVTGTEKKRRPHLSRKKAVILALTLVIIGLLLIVSTAVFRAPKQAARPHANNAAIDKLPPDQQANAYALKKDYTKAQQILMEQANKTSDKTDKSAIYAQQTSIALNADKGSDALKYALQSDALTPSSDTAEFVGLAYAAQGDKTNAKKYYDIALSRLTGKGNLSNRESQILMDIQDLEK